ncbi:MAG: sulfurtransferase complex subunit TusB [Desulfobacterales bacterium]|nr:sulfurtransferase complex subunit TusB [Desulfobacterales bacterium]
MNTLYVISRSSFQRNEAFLDFKLAEKGDGVIFIQDGVLLLKNPKNILRALKEKEVEVFALKEDLNARGLITDIKIVDYDSFADLLLLYKRAMQ